MKEATISLDDDPTLGSDLTLCNDVIGSDHDVIGSDQGEREIPLIEIESSETPVGSDQPEETRAKFQHQNSVTSLLQEISDLNGEVNLGHLLGSRLTPRFPVRKISAFLPFRRD